MKFTAVVDRILPHERLVGTGVRETYKNVIHLLVTDKNGVVTAQQPQSEVAGSMELHIPSDVEWDAAEPGLLVNVEVTVKKVKEAAPSKPKSTKSTSRSGSKSKPRRSKTSKPRAKSSGSRTRKAKPVPRAPSDLTSPTTKP